MNKYRIKIEVKESGNLYIPQVYCGFFSGWCGFTEFPTIYGGNDRSYLTKEEAKEVIEDYKKRQTIKTIYQVL